jgi:hypothetical protein
MLLDIICFSKYPPFMEVKKWQALKCHSITLQKSYWDFMYNVKPQHEGVPNIGSIGQGNSQFQPYILGMSSTHALYTMYNKTYVNHKV